jgi:uncharacterized membrane protein
MNWYLVVKFLHIIAVTITIGGMFARQLVRGFAKKSEDVNVVASLIRVAVRIDRALVIPWSNIMILMGIILAIMQKWPVFGFFQGASQNWLLVSNILLVVMLTAIFGVFVPHNKKVEVLLQSSLAEGRINPELSAALDDKTNKLAHYVEEISILIIAALMVLKPF